MQMTPVSSSHVEAFAYFEQELFLLVKFKGGALQGWLDFTDKQAADFLAAESKGKFLAALQNHSVAIQRKPAIINLPQQPQPLNTIDEDAGKCCQKTMKNRTDLQTALLFACDCGLQFVPEMVGPVRHWRIKPFVKVLRA